MLADEMISHKIDEVALRILCREHNATPEEVKKPSRNRACSRWRKQARRRAIRRQAPLHAAGLLQGEKSRAPQGGQRSVHPRLRTRGARDESMVREWLRSRLSNRNSQRPTPCSGATSSTPCRKSTTDSSRSERFPSKDDAADPSLSVSRNLVRDIKLIKSN